MAEFPFFAITSKAELNPESQDSPIIVVTGNFLWKKEVGIIAEHLSTREWSEGNTSDYEIAHYQP